MKVLQVLHQFLPLHPAGTEYYTYYLSKELQKRGHELTLFFTEIRHDRPQYEVETGAYDGLPFYEVVHNRDFPDFEHTYENPVMEGIFRDVLDAVDPDVVHLQHLFLHSIGYVDELVRRGKPIVYTLHEFMIMCLRHGQLLRDGYELCEGPEPDECARCAKMFPAPSRSQTDDPYSGAVERRRAEHARRLAQVDLFLSPSAFLRDRFVREKLIAADRILHSDNGFRVEPYAGVERPRHEGLRVGFVGMIGEWKGVHLICEAFSQIDAPGVTCEIWGELTLFPDYIERLRAMAGPNVRLMGPCANTDVAEVMASLDLLIVPSLWFENSPLTIHEAFLAGTPVLTADRGGMAELVTEGKNGLHFRLGDAADLRRQIQRCIDDPDLLPSLRAFPQIKTIEQDTDLMEERYRSLLAGERPVR